MPTRRRLVVLAVLAALLAGCGGGGDRSLGNSSAAPGTTSTVPPPPVSSIIAASVPPTAAVLAEGRKLFQTALNPAGCSYCHSFRAAVTTSVIGPSLDAEVTEPDLASYTDAQLSQRVLNWIEQGLCVAPTDPSRCMPAGLWSGQRADSIAVFVAICGRKPRTEGCAPVAGGLTGLARRGEQLFQTRGCTGCHFTESGPAVGPVLNGLAGSKVQLATGQTIVADDGYLTASIATPDAQIVKGYPAGMMSARVLPQHLTPAQIRALVAYIDALK